MAEGRKMFLEAPESWVSQVFVSETVSRDGELMSQAEKYPCEIVKDSVFRQMCDTKTPQGILTVLKLPSWSEEEVLAGENPLVMVLEDLQDPGNAGTILRTGEGAAERAHVAGLAASRGIKDRAVQLHEPAVFALLAGEHARLQLPGVRVRFIDADRVQGFPLRFSVFPLFYHKIAKNKRDFSAVSLDKRAARQYDKR